MAKDMPSLGTFFGVPSSDSMEQIIEDHRLRNALIDASLKMEEMLSDGRITLENNIISKRVWGLEIEIEMARPKENKPIIFRYTYRINRVVFQEWLDDHPYLQGGPLLMFSDRGMDFVVYTRQPYTTTASIVVKYDNDTYRVPKYEPPIVEEPITIVVHREVVSNHDWIVKCIVT